MYPCMMKRNEILRGEHKPHDPFNALQLHFALGVFVCLSIARDANVKSVGYVERMELVLNNQNYFQPSYITTLIRLEDWGSTFVGTNK